MEAVSFITQKVALDNFTAARTKNLADDDAIKLDPTESTWAHSKATRVVVNCACHLPVFVYRLCLLPLHSLTHSLTPWHYSPDGRKPPLIRFHSLIQCICGASG
jgi:hypothetical protein